MEVLVLRRYVNIPVVADRTLELAMTFLRNGALRRRRLRFIRIARFLSEDLKATLRRRLRGLRLRVYFLREPGIVRGLYQTNKLSFEVRGVTALTLTI